MTTHNYTQPLVGPERTVERPDGTRIRTVLVGSGRRTALLAHGYGSEAASWNLIAPQLAAQGFRVIAFDQRGHGNSSIGSDGVSSQHMAGDYGAILESYDVQDGVLVGHSMGGFLALKFLLDQPLLATQRVGSLVLMATFAGDVNRKNPQNRFQIPLIKSGILTRLVRFKPIAQAFTKSLTGDKFEPEMADAFIPGFLAADHPRLVPILEAMVEENLYPRLGELDLPCTIAIGSKDKTTPPFHTADLHARIKGSKLITLPGVGHAPNWEAPEDIVSAISSMA